MRFAPFRQEGIDGLAVVNHAGIATGLIEPDPNYPGKLEILIQRGIADFIGYAIFNDASVRDYQFKTSQWTVGKNFDGTGSFGPALVTADELPAGCKGLKLVTRLNGEVVQSTMIDEMVFDVATQISLISEAITLSSGDVFVTGTPAGVGLSRKPPLWMKAGDLCEVEIDRLGILRNPVVDEPAVGSARQARTYGRA
jgi:fumarylacetoacetate (FAA) hydrolase family protein